MKTCRNCIFYEQEDEESMNPDAQEDYGTCHAPLPICNDDFSYAQDTTADTVAKQCELFKRTNR